MRELNHVLKARRAPAARCPEPQTCSRLISMPRCLPACGHALSLRRPASCVPVGVRRTAYGVRRAGLACPLASLAARHLWWAVGWRFSWWEGLWQNDPWSQRAEQSFRLVPGRCTVHLHRGGSDGGPAPPDHQPPSVGDLWQSREPDVDIIDELTGPTKRDDVPDFRAGDTIKVHVKVVEGNRSRVQVSGRRAKLQAPRVGRTLTVRKVSFGVGVRAHLPDAHADLREDRIGHSR